MINLSGCIVLPLRVAKIFQTRKIQRFDKTLTNDLHAHENSLMCKQFTIKVFNYKQKILKYLNIEEKFSKNSLKTWMFPSTYSRKHINLKKSTETYKLFKNFNKTNKEIILKVKIFENMTCNTLKTKQKHVQNIKKWHKFKWKQENFIIKICESYGYYINPLNIKQNK